MIYKKKVKCGITSYADRLFLFTKFLHVKKIEFIYLTLTMCVGMFWNFSIIQFILEIVQEKPYWN